MLDGLILFYTDICIYSLIPDILVILMSYSFIKLLLLSSIVELIWPTQIFNKKNSSSSIKFRFRSLIEFFSKLRASPVKKKIHISLFTQYSHFTLLFV